TGPVLGGKWPGGRLTVLYPITWRRATAYFPSRQSRSMPPLSTCPPALLFDTSAGGDHRALDDPEPKRRFASATQAMRDARSSCVREATTDISSVAANGIRRVSYFLLVMQ